MLSLSNNSETKNKMIADNYTVFITQFEELSFQDDGEQAIFALTGLLLSMVIIMANASLLIHIKLSEVKLTLMDKLLVTDCVVNIAVVPVIWMKGVTVTKSDWFCVVQDILAISSGVMNRLLPICIMVYRYLYTCHSTRLQTNGQKQRLSVITVGTTMMWMTIYIIIHTIYM